MGGGWEPADWREHPLGQRRARIVKAMVEVVCEREGFAGASVTAVCAHAKVSGRGFYEIFASREDCFLAALDEGHRRASQEVSCAFEGAESWLDGVRLALVALLTFLDSEPGLARVCVVESLAAGHWALERRERHVASLTRQIAEFWGQRGPQEPYPFAAEGVMASVLNIIQNRLRADEAQPLSVLLGPLMGLATTPYLDAREVADEIKRSEALAQRLAASSDPQLRPGAGRGRVQVPAMLRNPRAHRARECLLYLAEHPDASNRQIAKAIGIARDTQVSTMLARLREMRLLVKHGAKPGGSNAWMLTAYGLAVARASSDDSDDPRGVRLT